MFIHNIQSKVFQQCLFYQSLLGGLVDLKKYINTVIWVWIKPEYIITLSEVFQKEWSDCQQEKKETYPILRASQEGINEKNRVSSFLKQSHLLIRYNIKVI